jgi:hypothetical protein
MQQARGSFRRRGSHRNGGWIMFLTMLSLLLLVSMVMWVINLGQQVERRAMVQHSADSAAQAAAGWASRAMNTISANNADMARTIALINLLDSFPEAADWANRELKTFRDSLEAQISSGVAEPNNALRTEVTTQLSVLLAEMADDEADLQPVVDMFATIDVTEMTFYAKDGHLWRSLFAMDQTNQSIVENFGLAVQHAGLRAGERNQQYAPGENASIVVVPTQPYLPHQRGGFDDFQRPVRHGVLPIGMDDPITRRGPWDAVWGWRTWLYEGGTGTNTPGSRQVVGGGRPNTIAGSRPNSNGTVEGREKIGYVVRGPHFELLDWIYNYNRDSLEHARLYMWMDRISDIKLNYLWPQANPRWHHVHAPQWIITYEEALAVAAARTPRILQTAYFVVEIKSSIPEGGAGFMSPGTYALARDDSNGGENPRVHYLGRPNGNRHGTGAGPNRGWYDAATWGIEKLNNHVWKDKWEYDVNWDGSIGLEREENPDGSLKTHRVYRYDYFAFAGVNVNPDVNPRNPWEGLNRGSQEAPSPMNLDLSVVDGDQEEGKWDHLKFLAIARQTDAPQAWPSRFQGGRPYPNSVAIAQARVFNDHSWDMWTQMWKAELEPVTNRNGTPGIYDWANRLSAGGPSVPVEGQDLENLRQYLLSLSDLATTTLGH